MAYVLACLPAPADCAPVLRPRHVNGCTATVQLPSMHVAPTLSRTLASQPAGPSQPSSLNNACARMPSKHGILTWLHAAARRHGRPPTHPQAQLGRTRCSQQSQAAAAATMSPLRASLATPVSGVRSGRMPKQLDSYEAQVGRWAGGQTCLGVRFAPRHAYPSLCRHLSCNGRRRHRYVTREGGIGAVVKLYRCKCNLCTGGHRLPRPAIQACAVSPGR